MKIFLTGANGFVGSHILDQLRAAGHAVTLLLRPTSDTRFIQSHLDHVRVVRGGLLDTDALNDALEGVTHVLHCAGATKAVREDGLFTVNQQGTRALVEAVNARGGQVKRFVHVSSLAAGRPGTRNDPAREDDPPAPRSAYGRSKLAAEQEVRARCAVEWTILRPAAVLGPRDREFLPLFQAVQRGWAPVFDGGRQELSLVMVRDVAAMTVAALTAPDVAGGVFNLVGPEVATTRELVQAIGVALDRAPRLLPLPWAVLRLACALQAAWAHLSGSATVLAHGKYRELSAPGWVADGSRLRAALGAGPSTPLADGLRQTAVWYRETGWL
jgi:nucleoside-diphosphate-sugar epimerase